MKICVPITTKNIEEVKNRMKEIDSHYSDKVSVIEIWFGEFFSESVIENTTDIYEYTDMLLSEIFEQRNRLQTYFSLLFTIKGEKEQGNFAGTGANTKEISRRILRTIQVFSRGKDEKYAHMPDYLDLDYNFDEENSYAFFEEIQQIRERQSLSKNVFQLILSAHFFDGTPRFPSLKNRIQLMRNRGADIVKVAAMPSEEKDVVTIFRLAENLKRKEIPYITISMGNMGKISRLVTLLWGGEMMFASLSKENASASGQMTIDEFSSFLSFFVF